MTRDISPAAKHVSANILNWLGYLVTACGRLLPGKESEEKKSLLGQLSNGSPVFKHEDVQNGFECEFLQCVRM